MTTLKLGAQGLSDPEIGLVKTLLKLMATEPEFSWIFATNGPFDALLADASVAEPNKDAVCVIQLVTQGHAVAPGQFARPINAPALEGWLRSAERQLKPTVYMGLDYQTHASALQDKPVPRFQAAASSAPVQDTGERYKLIRWPPPMTLRNDRNRVRLATLITRQAMDLKQLAQISGQSVAECGAFIMVLNSLSLVQ